MRKPRRRLPLPSRIRARPDRSRAVRRSDPALAGRLDLGAQPLRQRPRSACATASAGSISTRTARPCAQATHQTLCSSVVSPTNSTAGLIAMLGVEEAQRHRLHRRRRGDRRLQQVGVERQQHAAVAVVPSGNDRHRVAGLQRRSHLVHHAHRIAPALALEVERARRVDQPCRPAASGARRLLETKRAAHDGVDRAGYRATRRGCATSSIAPGLRRPDDRARRPCNAGSLRRPPLHVRGARAAASSVPEAHRARSPRRAARARRSARGATRAQVAQPVDGEAPRLSDRSLGRRPASAPPRPA